MKTSAAAPGDLPRFLSEKFGFYESAEQERINDAWAWIQAYCNSADVRSLEAAAVLAELRFDVDAVIAAMLHEAREHAAKDAAFRKAVRERFGEGVAVLVDGAARIAGVSAAGKTIQEAENVRKMLFAMTSDIRVIFIKLAGSLAVMRGFDGPGAGGASASLRANMAQECLNIYAPLADRLGISWMKDELEDLALKYLNREVFSHIKEIVSLKKEERQKYLDTVRDIIVKEAADTGIAIEVESRAKHFYSIYQKMRKRGKNPEELYDLFGIRILCDTIENCYTLLGLVHRLWKPLDRRFKDYIARPKSNGYQSLHTTVFVSSPASPVPGRRFPWSPLSEKYGNGQPLEIQIRTREMHRVAEYGIASHWLYKKGSSREIVRPAALPLINRLKEWKPAGTGILDSQSSVSFLDSIKKEMLKDSIFVFTPQGKIIELPVGATPIDFAYAVHTDIGNHCCGAKADGSIVPLDGGLRSTQVVEILTAVNAQPHINWLRTAKTAKARGKIRSWLRRNNSLLNIEKNAAAGKKNARPPPRTNAPPPPAPRFRQITPDRIHDPAALQVRLESEREPAGKNIMIRFARCCHPMPGDLITGYVSRGRGIIVHRKDCPNLANISGREDRKIEIEWEKSPDITVKRFKVEARPHAGLFPEIEGAVRRHRGRIIESRLEENSPNRVTGFFTIHLEPAGGAGRVLKSIRSIPGILNIYPLN
jgi:GTP pyrophosphokinase